MRLIIDDVRHLKLKENLLWLGTLTLATVVIWVFYSIYIAYTKPIEDPQIASLLKPFNPELDQEAITLLGEEISLPAEFTIINEEALDSSIFSGGSTTKSSSASSVNR